jgi:peptidoglycan/LPS O-acetylase OafA/YrhL
MTQPTPESAKIQSLEGLRGAMAWWVVIGHVSLALGWNLWLINKNTLPVDVFILLSGFVIARLILRKQERYGPYIVRRGFRLFPLYLVILAVSALLLHVQLGAWQALPETAANLNRIKLVNSALSQMTAHVLAHVPLAQGLIPNGILDSAAYTIVGQAWSISLEWQFYLLAPFIVSLITSPRKWPIVLVAAAALMVATAWFSGAFLGAKILHFLVGISSYLAFNHSPDRRKWIAASVLLAMAVLAKDGMMQAIPLAIWAMVLASAATLPHSRLHWLARALGSKLAVHFGERSYSIYLVHMIPLYTSVYWYNRGGLTSSAFEVAVLLSTVLGTYLISQATYHVIEKPGIRIGARLTRPKASG